MLANCTDGVAPSLNQPSTLTFAGSRLATSATVTLLTTSLFRAAGVGLTTIVNIASATLANVAAVHVTGPLPVQPLDAETSVASVGKVSVTVTLVALSGP